MVIPDEILDELNYDKDIISDIFLILTCAHTVAYAEKMPCDKFKKA
jgi:hypothetical protein